MSLQRRTQGLETPHLLIECRELLFEEMLDLTAFLSVLTSPQEIADLGEGKAEGLRLLNKMQSCEGFRAVEAIARRRPYGFREQRFAFVEPDCVAAQAHLGRQYTNF
jgi:hypothetical protein